MNRLFLTKLHLILAGFMFPAMLMFLATGALYTWGSKGEWHEETVSVVLDQPLAADQRGLEIIALAELAKRGLPAPSGEASVSGEGADIALSWTGARSEATVKATDDPRLAEVTIKEASFHRWLVQLHKAKGSTIFKVYATFLAFVLFVLVASGVILGLQVKPFRRLTIGSGVAGVVAFLGFVLMG
ncbi:PepSY domain-containing protein [Altererythrobacter litoralis]|uniref:PepSY domain-containing protein n=1 Tax=Altererythrobacter litoralis TaxID=3113904 RepID=A0ABU7GBM7_9SPHN|nr:PepSY domain-containing protein [Erythrobacteraceae bacterium 1XM1-14]